MIIIMNKFSNIYHALRVCSPQKTGTGSYIRNILFWTDKHLEFTDLL